MSAVSHDKWLEAVAATVASYRRMIDGAVSQLSDVEFHQRPSPDVNSVAVILRHLGGNLIDCMCVLITKTKWQLEGIAMDRRRASVTVLRAIALLATACVHPSFGQAPEAETPAQRQLTEVVELPHQTLAFKPTRDDITVGCAIVSLFQSDLGKALPLESIRVNGVQPKSARLYLKRVGKNRFELPAVKIEFSSKELGGPLYLSIKVWFNELTNQYDSPFYERVPDRYALLSYCTKEDDDPSKVNARLGANRVASLKEFRERLGKPFVIPLNQQPLREEWGRWPMINNAARKLSDADLKAIEQSVRDRGEKYVINISAQDRDHAVVGVGDHDLFEGTRVYELARTDGTWQIEKVEDRQ